MLIRDLWDQSLREPHNDEPDSDWIKLASMGTSEVFEKAIETLTATNYGARLVAVKILTHLRNPELEDRRLQSLKGLMEIESDSDVLSALAVSMHHFEARSVLPILRELQQHPASVVRSGAFFGLSAMTDNISDFLIALEDPEEEVYSWAASELVSQTRFDSPRIRESLLNILKNDPECEEAYEALAVREDTRAIPLLKRRLESETVGYQAVSAAKRFAVKELLTPLTKLKSVWKERNHWLLEEAIEACEQ